MCIHLTKHSAISLLPIPPPLLNHSSPAMTPQFDMFYLRIKTKQNLVSQLEVNMYKCIEPPTGAQVDFQRPQPWENPSTPSNHLLPIHSQLVVRLQKPFPIYSGILSGLILVRQLLKLWVHVCSCLDILADHFMAQVHSLCLWKSFYALFYDDSLRIS
jgi:hypothetical protein